MKYKKRIIRKEQKERRIINRNNAMPGDVRNGTNLNIWLWLEAIVLDVPTRNL